MCLRPLSHPSGSGSVAARVATGKEILACHDRLYFDRARADIAGGSDLLSTGDTHVCAGSFDVALAAAGSVLNAIDGVFDGSFENAFCAVRPPGHHASSDRGMGFCIFNNVAIAARYAQRKHGAERVVIIDWDVHHGNGTQDIFYGDGSVFYFSTHQSPWYPGTGSAVETGDGEGEGTTLNGPFPAGSGYAQINALLCDQFSRAMEKFRPDLVLVSAGFDSRIGDPLGDFTLTDGQFVELTKRLLEIAHKSAAGLIAKVSTVPAGDGAKSKQKRFRHHHGEGRHDPTAYAGRVLLEEWAYANVDASRPIVLGLGEWQFLGGE